MMGVAAGLGARPSLNPSRLLGMSLEGSLPHLENLDLPV